jgi:hypothetical protein
MRYIYFIILTALMPNISLAHSYKSQCLTVLNFYENVVDTGIQCLFDVKRGVHFTFNCRLYHESLHMRSPSGERYAVILNNNTIFFDMTKHCLPDFRRRVVLRRITAKETMRRVAIHKQKMIINTFNTTP